MKNRKLLNSELERISIEEYKNKNGAGFAVVLDNIRSAHNVGSVFRTCDAFKADKVYLCGISACPSSAEIHKAALGAEYSVDWEYFEDTLDAIAKLRAEGYLPVSLEQTEKSLMLNEWTPKSGEKYAFVFGNEVDGVRQDVVDESEFCLEIPQFGTKHSLNVSVSAGIALWHFTAHKPI